MGVGGRMIRTNRSDEGYWGAVAFDEALNRFS